MSDQLSGAYAGFAGVYERFMQEAEVPYAAWAAFVQELIARYGVSQPLQAGTAPADALQQERALVVERGCGTGAFTRALSALGYDLCGIDVSAEMLAEAQRRQAAEGGSILYLEQDMRELDLYCTAGTFVSVYDSMNYLLTETDLLQTLRLVNNFLYPGGIFIFDFNTLYKYRDVMGDTTFAVHLADGSTMLWENAFYMEGETEETPETCVNEATLTFFVREAAADTGIPLYRRFSEVHDQRGWTLDEVTRLVTEAGLEVVTALDADTHDAPTDTSERIYMVARKIMK